ncbi:amino acid adenylation domain-containing protein [bacterium 1XD42-1]|nr:amino acid adenylation domain-containing protein [bacterium 1XD42-8]RKJ62191.1 amino acid adenylation domain-containing protein [bacterium 1XD42-1]
MKKNVIEYLIDSVQKYPNKVALVDKNRKITFAELDYEVKKVATAILQTCGPIKNQPIIVYMKKSIDCIVSFLGIVYSGNFYSPIDIKMPQERIGKILDKLHPAFVIYGKNPLETYEKSDCQMSFEQIVSSTQLAEPINNFRRVLDTDPVYVLFTSGSTGQPKGVSICHHAVIDYTEWLHDVFQFDEHTVFGNQAPFYFDNSILDIYSTLKNASTLNIIPTQMFLLPNNLLEYLNSSEINTLFWVPTALINLANSGLLSKIRLENIEKVLFCGEVMPNKQLNIWRKEYPSVLFANLYGPTEITDVCTYYIVNRDFSDDEPLPIGKACENTEILVLNDNNLLVNGDEVGELCVRGAGLSLGYYRDKEKTAQAFVQNPLNNRYHELIYRTGDLVKYNEYGELLFIGRKDQQIKHQGYRIELGEIEAISSAFNGLERVCAVYDDKNEKITLFCSVKDGCEGVTQKEIYCYLKKHLSSYMLPSSIFIKKELPLNINGKIDRISLKEELYKRKDY